MKQLAAVPSSRVAQACSAIRFRTYRACLGLLLLWLLSAGGRSLAAAEQKLELKGGDRVVFLGSELTEQAIKHNFLEAWLSANWPDQQISFRNLGWAGDDPTAIARGYFDGAAEGYRRLLEEIDRLKPTVIFVEYGETGAYEGEEGVREFMESYDRLIQDLKQRTEKIIVVSPPPAEKRPAPLRDPTTVNGTRASMTAKLKAFAQKQGFAFVDLLTPLQTPLTTGDSQYTHDTIRYTPNGYELLARTTLKQLGVSVPEGKLPDAELLKRIARKNDLYFHRYRPQNETYLRGFRKYEQGQNAKEIAEFDALIEHVETQIAALLQGKPVPPDFEIPEPAPLAFKPLAPEDQLNTFKMADGLEIQLFAAEPLSPNPIQMNFDSRGRLWVASSPIYPQLRPGAEPNDSIIILEDTDGDGLADKKTVFADGLLIPTAVLPDEQGGAYVANSTELIHIADTDGDGVGDERHVLLSGFGTEDTHHILHTFRWSPDVLLSFNQSIYIHSHLETPYGVERMLGSGVWRYRKQSAHAAQVLYGMVNPWGLVFDKWGQSFATDGAGSQGIHYAFPGAAYLTAVGYDRVLSGMNPGRPKHCGLELISGRHFPDAWQDVLVAPDFRGNRINSFKLSPQGSGYVSTQMEDLLTSSDRAFRPVDVKLAPDGSLYIADWHDSIINHGEVDFRDPRRDDRHGRIFRVVAKNRAPAPAPKLESATVEQLLGMLTAPEQWTRQMARVQLTLRPEGEVAAATAGWVKKLDPRSENFEQQRLEALWTFQAINAIPPSLLEAILQSPDSRARAAGVRALSQSTQEFFGLGGEVPALAALERAVGDENAQVRLEAVNALREVGTARAAELAMRALDQEMDVYLDFALDLTMKRLQSQWLPEFQKGSIEFAGQPVKVLFAMKAIDNAATLQPLMTLLTANQVPEDRLQGVLASIGKFAGPNEVKALLERAHARPNERGPILKALVAAAERRDIPFQGQGQSLDRFLNLADGLQLAGLLKQNQFQSKMIAIIEKDSSPEALKQGALQGLKGLGDEAVLKRFSNDAQLDLALRRRAVIALLNLNPEAAAAVVVEMLTQATDEQASEFDEVLDAFLNDKAGPETLSRLLQDKQIPAQLATLAVRRAESKGEHAVPLVAAMRTAGGLSTVNKTLTPEEMLSLMDQVAQQGNPQRGEEIYRRKELTCINCHSIGGAGGLVGPDMLSLGASSPVDYIVDSLLNPSSKIKEGYHTIAVATVDGKVFNGILVREGADNLVIRDAQSQEITIPNDDIDERVNSTTSIMPGDLTDKLARDEFVDLVAFLASLGKEGPFKVPQNQFVRKWTTKEGKQLISRVDGTIHVADALPDRTLSFTIDVTTPGKIGFKPNSRYALYMTMGDGDQDLLSDSPLTVLDLPAGKHTFHLSLFVHRSQPILMEIVPVEGSQGRAEVLNR